MPEVQIRPAVAADLPILMALDHSCQTDYVWQMDVLHEESQAGAIFREIRLPRSVDIPYPRQRGNSVRKLEPSIGNAGSCYR